MVSCSDKITQHEIKTIPTHHHICCPCLSDPKLGNADGNSRAIPHSHIYGNANPNSDSDTNADAYPDAPASCDPCVDPVH